MNIQIFGKSKCFDTKKAERYFKERKIKYQFIEVTKYGMSKGELNSVIAAIGDVRSLVDNQLKEYSNLNINLITRDNVAEKLLATPKIFKTPIVRNGKKATLGYQPEIWKDWD